MTWKPLSLSLHDRRSARSTAPFCRTWWTGLRYRNSSWSTRTSSWQSYTDGQAGAPKLPFHGSRAIGDLCSFQYMNNSLSSLVPARVALEKRSAGTMVFTNTPKVETKTHTFIHTRHALSWTKSEDAIVMYLIFYIIIIIIIFYTL